MRVLDAVLYCSNMVLTTKIAAAGLVQLAGTGAGVGEVALVVKLVCFYPESTTPSEVGKPRYLDT